MWNQDGDERAGTERSRMKREQIYIYIYICSETEEDRSRRCIPFKAQRKKGRCRCARITTARARVFKKQKHKKLSPRNFKCQRAGTRARELYRGLYLSILHRAEGAGRKKIFFFRHQATKRARATIRPVSRARAGGLCESGALSTLSDGRPPAGFSGFFKIGRGPPEPLGGAARAFPHRGLKV